MSLFVDDNFVKYYNYIYDAFVTKCVVKDIYMGCRSEILWRADTSVGLGMENDIAEIVLQTDRKKMNVDFKVESVIDYVKGQIYYGCAGECYWRK